MRMHLILFACPKDQEIRLPRRFNRVSVAIDLCDRIEAGRPDKCPSELYSYAGRGPNAVQDVWRGEGCL